MTHATPPLPVTVVTASDHDRRRLVHLVAALREHIEDEVEYQVDNPTDPRSIPLEWDESAALCNLLWDTLTDVMHAIHGPEAARIDPFVLESESGASEGLARPDKFRRSRASGDSEYYTPQDLLDPVRAVLGTIDLDPASCEGAQATVQATTYYTKAHDGLSKPWYGKVFLNPPYDEAAPWCGYLLDQLAAGHTTEAILLVNNVASTRWYQRIVRHAAMTAHPLGRKRFRHATKHSKSPVWGSVLMYFGANVERFCEVFAPLGLVQPPPLSGTVPGSQLTFADAQAIR